MKEDGAQRNQRNANETNQTLRHQEHALGHQSMQCSVFTRNSHLNPPHWWHHAMLHDTVQSLLSRAMHGWNMFEDSLISETSRRSAPLETDTALRRPVDLCVRQLVVAGNHLPTLCQPSHNTCCEGLWSVNSCSIVTTTFMDDLRLHVLSHHHRFLWLFLLPNARPHRCNLIQIDGLIVAWRAFTSVAVGALALIIRGDLYDVGGRAGHQELPAALCLDLFTTKLRRSQGRLLLLLLWDCRIQPWRTRLSPLKVSRCEWLHHNVRRGSTCSCLHVWEVVGPRSIGAKLTTADLVNHLLQRVHWPYAHVSAVKRVCTLNRRRMASKDTTLLARYFGFGSPAQSCGLQAVAGQTSIIWLQKPSEDVGHLPRRKWPLQPTWESAQRWRGHQGPINSPWRGQSSSLSICYPGVNPRKIDNTCTANHNRQQQSLLLGRPCRFVIPCCHLQVPCIARHIMQDLMHKVCVWNSTPSIQCQQNARSNASVNNWVLCAIRDRMQDSHFSHAQRPRLSGRRLQRHLNVGLSNNPPRVCTFQSLLTTQDVMAESKCLHQGLWPRGCYRVGLLTQNKLPHIALIERKKRKMSMDCMPSVVHHDCICSFHHSNWVTSHPSPSTTPDSACLHLPTQAAGQLLKTKGLATAKTSISEAHLP